MYDADTNMRPLFLMASSLYLGKVLSYLYLERKKKKPLLHSAHWLGFHTSQGLLGNRVDSLAVSHSYFSVTQFSLV